MPSQTSGGLSVDFAPSKPIRSKIISDYDLLKVFQRAVSIRNDCTYILVWTWFDSIVEYNALLRPDFRFWDCGKIEAWSGGYRRGIMYELSRSPLSWDNWGRRTPKSCERNKTNKKQKRGRVKEEARKTETVPLLSSSQTEPIGWRRTERNRKKQGERSVHLIWVGHPFSLGTFHHAHFWSEGRGSRCSNKGRGRKETPQENGTKRKQQLLIVWSACA